MSIAWLSEEVVKFSGYTLTVGQLISSVVIFLATLVVSKVVQRALQRLSKPNRVISSAQLYIVGRFVHYIILLVGIFFAVSVLGIDLSKLALVASALGIGIGLGLQGIVNNFVSGLVVLLEKSLKVGDFVELSSGVFGEIKEIHMRLTVIRTNDNVDILVPNAELINGMVTNWTLEDNIRRFRIPFGVAYGSDKELVRKAVLDAANSVSYTLRTPNHMPSVWMTGFGDSSLNFVLCVWVSAEQVKRPSALTSDYLWAIDDELRKHRIEIPFPQRDLHLRSCQTEIKVDQSASK